MTGKKRCWARTPNLDCTVQSLLSRNAMRPVENLCRRSLAGWSTSIRLRRIRKMSGRFRARCMTTITGIENLTLWNSSLEAVPFFLEHKPIAYDEIHKRAGGNGEHIRDQVIQMAP